MASFQDRNNHHAIRGHRLTAVVTSETVAGTLTGLGIKWKLI